MAVKTSDNKPDGRFNDTRRRLLQKAKEMYYRQGYAGLSLQELADNVGITKAALFHHFKSKQELFFEIQMDICEDHRLSIQAAIDADSATRLRLRNVLLAFLRQPFFDPMKFLSDEYTKLDSKQQNEVDQGFEKAMYLPLKQIFEEGRQRGELRVENTHLAIMAFINLGMLLPTPGNPIVEAIPPAERENYIEQLLDLFWGGVARAE